jgi:hypothetical protein
MYFDAAKPWVVVSEKGCEEIAKNAALTLRNMRGAEGAFPDVIDAGAEAPSDCIIIINADLNSKKLSYSWRASETRVEIYGHSLESVEDAVNDFFKMLGESSSPDAGSKNAVSGTLFPLSRTHSYRPENKSLPLLK